VAIVFNSATNKGGFTNNFFCLEIFQSSALVADTRCLWLDDSTVAMYTRGDGGVQVNDHILLKAGTVKAKCKVLNSGPECALWASAATSSVLVQAPNKPIAPLVSIVAPSVLGPCDDLVLDLSGSRGSGGRSFQSVRFAVAGVHNNVSRISSLLNSGSDSALSRPSLVTHDLLAPGYAYSVTVMVCNFIGGCGQASHAVIVSSSINLPVVSLNAKTMQTMNRFNPLAISGRAYTSSCGGGVNTANLEYSWMISSADTDLTRTLPSISPDPRAFRLPAFSLSVGALYTVTLTVRHTVSLKSTSASVRLVVAQGSVVAVLTGSSEKGLRMNDELMIDASLSYDEDNAVVTGALSGLSFQFSCVQIAPTYKATSGLQMTTNDAGDVAILSVPIGANFSRTIHRVTVTVTDLTDLRSSSTSTVVTILPSLAPLISLVSTSGVRINPSNKLKLLAEVEVSAGAVATWSVDDASVDLNAIALSTVQRTLPPPTLPAISQSFTLSLVLPQNGLPQQSSFVFQLLVTADSGHSSSAAIVITTNAPPLPGVYTVQPSEGDAMTTLFRFSASQYEDSDIPVSYEFSYLSTVAADKYLVHRSRLEKAFATSVLPAGRASASNALTTRLQVFDVLDAKHVSFVDVAVESEQLTSEETQLFLENALNNSNGYADEMKNAVATTSSVINAVNCSRATNCHVLYRMNCSSTANTCGSCWDGFAGEFGHANSPCVEANFNTRRRLASWNVLSSASTAVCVVDSDCDENMWRVCLNGHCAFKQKECKNDCYDRGECVFVSTYNVSDKLDICSVSDSHCKAKCLCQSEYAGSSCELSVNDYHQTLATRHALAETILKISEVDDVLPDTLISWLDYLATICNDPDGLRTDTKQLIASLALDFISQASDLGLAYEDVAALPSILDLVLNMNEAESEADSTLALELLAAYSKFVSVEMAEGQNTVEVINELFRSSYFSLDGRDQVSVSTPRTLLEEMLASAAQTAQLPVRVDGGTFKVSVVETVVNVGNVSASVTGVPLGLRFDKSPCGQNTSQCFVMVTLQNSIRKMPVLNSTHHTVDFNCKKGIVSGEEHFCPNGHSLPLICNGTMNGVYIATCPLWEYLAMCSSVGADESECSLVGFNEESVTCRCSLGGASQRRRLQDNNRAPEEDHSVSVDFVSSGVRMLTEFADTWKSAGSLDTATVLDSIQVLITVAFIGIFSVSFICYAAFLDWKDGIKLSAESAFKSLGSVSRRRDDLKRFGNATVASVPTMSASAAVPQRTPPDGRVKPFPHPAPTPDRPRGYSRETSLSDISLFGMFGVNRGHSVVHKVAPQSQSQLQSRARSRLVGHVERERVEESLPMILKPLPLWRKFGNEVQMHHRWVGVVFHYSPAYSRPLRVLSLVMNILTMLFIEALTYDIADPDDGSCETYSSEEDCLREDSALSRGETKCYWRQDNGSCHIQAVENDFNRVIIVAIFAAAISTPFAFIFQSLIMYILSAETMITGEKEKMAAVRSSVSARRRVSSKVTSTVVSVETQQSLTQSLADLIRDMRSYRSRLSLERREEFDGRLLYTQDETPIKEINVCNNNIVYKYSDLHNDINGQTGTHSFICACVLCRGVGTGLGCRG
jgi:hypothetical protein